MHLLGFLCAFHAIDCETEEETYWRKPRHGTSQERAVGHISIGRACLLQARCKVGESACKWSVDDMIGGWSCERTACKRPVVPLQVEGHKGVGGG